MTKNKYQEVLNRIKVHVPEYKLINNHIVEVDKHSDLCKLQELIDRETPRKPLWDNNGYIKCNTCKLSLVSTNDQLINYCSNCGQKIDWSDEN